MYEYFENIIMFKPNFGTFFLGECLTFYLHYDTVHRKQTVYAMKWANAKTEKKTKQNKTNKQKQNTILVRLHK